MTRRKPAALHLIEGNPGHKTKAELDRGVTVDSRRPAEPRWADVWPSVRGDQDQQRHAGRLRGWSREEWRRVVPALANIGLLSSVDHQTLVRHCTTYAIMRQCLRDIAVRGSIVITERGAVRNPSTIALKQQQDALAKTEAVLGLTPLARDAFGASATPAPADDGNAANPFAASAG